MRLRNKKTGEIGWLYCDHIGNPKKMTVFLDDNDLSAEHWDYESLAELNAIWEDYKPTEPLIKDEKVRKAVRAWAEANDIERVWHECGSCWLRGNGLCIEMENEVDELVKDNYSIDELCGEEEE